jgi:hypothetical protein
MRPGRASWRNDVPMALWTKGSLEWEERARTQPSGIPLWTKGSLEWEERARTQPSGIPLWTKGSLEWEMT